MSLCDTDDTMIQLYKETGNSSDDIVTIEKAVTVAPPYTERTRRRADATFECSRYAYMYHFKYGK